MDTLKNILKGLCSLLIVGAGIAKCMQENSSDSTAPNVMPSSSIYHGSTDDNFEEGVIDDPGEDVIDDPIEIPQKYTRCPVCGGFGRCGGCGGTGMIYSVFYGDSFEVGEGRYVDCGACDGTGACGACDGTGYVEDFSF